MHFEFHWQNDQNGSPVTFRTDDPAIGEAMMRSSSDFPKRSEEVQQQFDAVYRPQRGKFEAILRNATVNPTVSYIETGIRGLTIQLKRVANVVFDLPDRPNHYL